MLAERESAPPVEEIKIPKFAVQVCLSFRICSFIDIDALVLKAGHSADGLPLYVARASYLGNTYPGTVCLSK